MGWLVQKSGARHYSWRCGPGKQVKCERPRSRRLAVKLGKVGWFAANTGPRHHNLGTNVKNLRPDPLAGGYALRRWALNLLRAAHVAGLIGTGSALFGGTPPPVFPLLLLGSGLAMAGLDLWRNPAYLRQMAGAWIVIKLALVAWLAFDVSQAGWLFWLILVLSVLAAHAPAGFRHKELWRAS